MSLQTHTSETFKGPKAFFFLQPPLRLARDIVKIKDTDVFFSLSKLFLQKYLSQCDCVAAAHFKAASSKLIASAGINKVAAHL